MLPTANSVTYRCDRPVVDFQVEIQRNAIDTVQKVHQYACEKYGDRNAFGTREILSEFSEKQKNGKVFIKVSSFKITGHSKITSRHF